MKKGIIKNKYIIIFMVICLLFILNIFSLKAFFYNYKGINIYENKGFTGAIVDFENAGNIYGAYNKANSLYKQKKYKDSIKEYMSILLNNSDSLDFKVNYNIANNFYRLGEGEDEGGKKIKNWEKAVEYYRNALNLKYDEGAKQNLEFVLSKIKEEKEKELEKDDSEEQEGEKSEEKDGEEGDKSEEGKGGEEKDGEKGDEEGKEEGGEEKDGDEGGEEKSGEKGDKEGEGGQEGGQEENNLTSEQEKALEQYEEALKQEQKNNADNFNKVYEENNDPFDNVFNDPFFNNNLLNGGGEEKDW